MSVKLQLNKVLNSIDEFLDSQKESEQKLFFLLPVLLFGFLSYYFLYPITNSSLENQTLKNQQMNKELRQIDINNIGLKNFNIRLINRIKKDDKLLKELIQQKIEVDNSLTQLHFFRFDLDKWAEFYNTIPSIAKKYHLLILNLNNNMFLDNIKDKQLIHKKMELKIEVVGDFINFIKFIHSFESLKELVKISYIKMDKDRMTIIIDIYGAKI